MKTDQKPENTLKTPLLRWGVYFVSVVIIYILLTTYGNKYYVTLMLLLVTLVTLREEITIMCYTKSYKKSLLNVTLGEKFTYCPTMRYEDSKGKSNIPDNTCWKGNITFGRYTPPKYGGVPGLRKIHLGGATYIEILRCGKRLFAFALESHSETRNRSAEA